MQGLGWPTEGGGGEPPERPHIAVLDDWEGALQRLADWSGIRARATLCFHRSRLRGAALLQALKPAQAVILNRDRTPFDAALLAQLPQLRYLVFTGPRNRQIDYSALHARGIPVSCTEGGPALESTSEHTWALVLAWARQLEPQRTWLRQGVWRPTRAPSLARVLHGERLGLVGCGRVGSRVAAMGLAFGMDVVTWSPHMTAERAAQSGARWVSLEELLGSSLVVSLHLVPGPQSHGLMSTARLALMRRDALLVNTARPELVDHEALACALRQGLIAGAALDVLPEEPLPPDHPLHNIENLVITPHTGFGAEAVFACFAQGAVGCLSAWLDNAVLPGPVTGF